MFVSHFRNGIGVKCTLRVDPITLKMNSDGATKYEMTDDERFYNWRKTNCVVRICGIAIEQPTAVIIHFSISKMCEFGLIAWENWESAILEKNDLLSSIQRYQMANGWPFNNPLFRGIEANCNIVPLSGELDHHQPVAHFHFMIIDFEN